MKIVLAYVISKGASQSLAPFNLVSLATYLTIHKIVSKEDIKILDYDEDLIAYATYKRPDVIGFSVLTSSYQYCVKIASKIKKIYNPTMLIGGPHISGVPQSLQFPFDIGVIGEGEQTLAELLKMLQKKDPLSHDQLFKIKGIAYRHNGKVIVTPPRPFLKAKDIPYNDYSFIPREKIFSYRTILHGDVVRMVKWTHLSSSRGCPYKCIYCANRTIWTNASGVRFYDVKRVGKELEFMYKNYGIECIVFWDDTFAISKQRLRELIEELKKRKLLGKLVFDHIFIKSNLIDEEFALLLKEFGVISVFLGIESGSQRIMNLLKNKSQTINDVKNAIQIFSKYKIGIVGSFMVFSPTETIKDLTKTLTFIRWFVRQKNSLSLGITTTTPFPGTKLWEDSMNNIYPLVNKDKVRKNYNDLFLNTKFKQSFFKLNLSIAQQKKVWKSFIKEQKYLINKIHRINEYSTINREAERHTNKLKENWRIRSEFKYRLYRLLNRPFYTLKKLIFHPRKLKYIIGDIKVIINRAMRK